MNTNHHGGFDYTYDPDVKAAVEVQEKKANALKVDSVQGMAGAGVNQRLMQVNSYDHQGGFDYQYEPELKAIIDAQEKQANSLKCSSVQGMSECGVNKRLMQVNSKHHGGFDYTYDPDVKAAVEVQEKKANALKVDSVQGMAGAGVNQRLS